MTVYDASCLAKDRSCLHFFYLWCSVNGGRLLSDLQYLTNFYFFFLFFVKLSYVLIQLVFGWLPVDMSQRVSVLKLAFGCGREPLLNQCLTLIEIDWREGRRERHEAEGESHGLQEGVSGKWSCFNIKDNPTQDFAKTLH